MRELSLSYSALSTALRCNRLYQHLFIDKLVPEEPESLDLHFGTALHAGLNALVEGDSSGAFDAYWDSILSLDFAKGRHTLDDLRNMGRLFLDRFSKLQLKNFKLTHAEDRLFGFTPNGMRIEGTPDFIGQHKGSLTVIDFKTSGTRYPEGKARASDQLMLYAWLAQQALGIKIEQVGYVVFIKTREPSIQTQIIPLSQEVLLERILNIELHCKELAAKQVFPQNFNACHQFGRRCAFWNKCHGEDK